MATGVNVIGQDQWYTIDQHCGIFGLRFCIAMNVLPSLPAWHMWAYQGILYGYSTSVDQHSIVAIQYDAAC
jgi:hypothetical protein